MLSLLPLLLAAAAPLPAAPLLSPARIKADVATLAADDFHGRGPTQAGEAKTLDFLGARFKALGLQPLGKDGTYFQDVPMWRWTRTGATLSATIAGKAVPLRPGIEITATARTDGVVELKDVPVVFAGYGVVDPKLGYDPFAGLDVRGKVVLVLAGDPDVEAGRDLGFGGRAAVIATRTKASEAISRGAIGYLIIHDTFPSSYPWLQVANGDALPGYALDDGSTPAPAGLRGQVRTDVGAAMLKAAGLDYAAAKKAAQAANYRGVALPGVTLSARIATRQERVVSHNVVGLLPGTTRAAETILYGAHWDANGENATDPGPDRIRNGAIDNATGTATLLEIARVFAAGPKPARGIVFALWTAEEKGLLGASWYAGHPLRPLETTAAQFNLDPHVVLGRTRDIELIGVGRTPLEAELTRVAATQGLAVVPEENTEAGWYFRSDHFAFAEKGVPGVYFRAGRDLVAGGHAAGEAKRADYNARCYHQTCDAADPAWDMTGAAQEGSVALALGRTLAGSGAWPGWNPDQPFAAVRAQSDAARR